MKFYFNDGGRLVAGFKGQTRDCVCRAISIAMQRPYASVYEDLSRRCESEGTPKCMGRNSPRTGIAKETLRSYMSQYGWVWYPTMAIGSGCTVHLRDGELPMGRLVVNVSRHSVAVIDGVVNDIFDCTRDGSRCVYGYFLKGS